MSIYHPEATPLPSPAELDELHPLDPVATELIVDTRQQVIDIMNGTDDRLLAVFGPCSMDDSKTDGDLSVVRFAEQLQVVGRKVAENVLVVLRCPPAKPRTDVGQRGMEQTSVVTAHGILTRLANQGMPLASEVMYPNHLAHYGDRLSLAWLGARNVEDTGIRHAMSAHPEIPVFAKNDSYGGLKAAQNAIKTIQEPHQNVMVMTHDGRMAVINSPGNPHTGIIWRAGYNYKDPESYERGLIETAELSLPYGIDMGHGAAVAHGGKTLEGVRATFEHATQILVDGKLRRPPALVMVEAYLLEGNDTSGNTPGKSLTDEAVGIQEATDMLLRLSEIHADLKT